MSRRIDPEKAVENYFLTADEMAATGTLRVAAAILSVRFPKATAPKPAAKLGRPRGAKNKANGAAEGLTVTGV